MESFSRSWNVLTCPLDKCQKCLIRSWKFIFDRKRGGHGLTDFGPYVEISDPREQVADSRMNHCHATFATVVRQHVAFGDAGPDSEMRRDSSTASGSALSRSLRMV